MLKVSDACRWDRDKDTASYGLDLDEYTTIYGRDLDEDTTSYGWNLDEDTKLFLRTEYEKLNVVLIKQKEKN